MTESKFTSKKTFIKQFIMHSSHTVLRIFKFETETNGIQHPKGPSHYFVQNSSSKSFCYFRTSYATLTSTTESQSRHLVSVKYM